MINPRSVALEGIGFTPRAIAVLGFDLISIEISVPESSSTGGIGSLIGQPATITITINWNEQTFKKTFQHKVVDSIVNILVQMKKATTVFVRRLYPEGNAVSISIKRDSNDNNKLR